MKTSQANSGPVIEMPDPLRSGSADACTERRYLPARNHAYLGWWDGDAFRTEPGWLEGLSAVDAALEIEADPGPGNAVWLCVVCPERTAWVPARLAERCGRQVRVAFTERFPYETFVANV